MKNNKRYSYEIGTKDSCYKDYCHFPPSFDLNKIPKHYLAQYTVLIKNAYQ